MHKYITKHTCIPTNGRSDGRRTEKKDRKKNRYTCLPTNLQTYVHTYLTYIHTYIHSYIHTYVRTYIHTYTHAYIHTHIRTYIHTYIHICMQTYIQTCIDTPSSYVHTHMCTCVLRTQKPQLARLVWYMKIGICGIDNKGLTVHNETSQPQAQPLKQVKGLGVGFGLVMLRVTAIKWSLLERSTAPAKTTRTRSHQCRCSMSNIETGVVSRILGPGVSGSVGQTARSHPVIRMDILETTKTQSTEHEPGTLLCRLAQA